METAGGMPSVPPSEPPSSSEATLTMNMDNMTPEEGNASMASLPPPPPPAVLTGRVVRLHFSCHAELPMGSFLRVTGSTLWAPGTAALDPSDATPAVGRTEQGAFPVSNSAAGDEDGEQRTAVSSLYTSSVEMVTTPEEYPVWRTRSPVTLVLHSSKKTVQHHYYRYLVVSPGSMIGNHSGAPGINDPWALEDGVMDDDDMNAATMVSTSSEAIGSTAVMQWEDPFGSFVQHHLQQQQQQQQGAGSSVQHGGMSSLSLASYSSVMALHPAKADYRNLPFRTLDISVTTGQPILDDPALVNAAATAHNNARLDRFNNAEDESFRTYLIREAIHQENRRKAQPPKSLLSDITDRSDADVLLASEVAHDDGDDTAMLEDGPVAVAAPGQAPVLERMDMVQNTMALTTAGVTSSAHSVATSTATRDGATTPPAFAGNSRIFFICFHLPVVVIQHPTTGEWRASWSESILAKTEGSQILSTYQALWVGTVTTHPPMQSDADKQAVRAILEEMNCIPIFLDPAVQQSHYYGFCKQVLWPAFHNIDMLDLSTCGWLSDPNMVASDWDQSRLNDWWMAYLQVSLEFSTMLRGMVRPGDILWIHDYHLSLLPEQLTSWEVSRYGSRVTRKVFFLHIPFPTSQIFRELECGEKILKGMHHADVVGFHAFDHARHFLNAAKRILGLNYESLVGGLIGVQFQGSTVLVSMSNVSIEPRMVDAALMLPSVNSGKDQIKAKHSGRVIICGVDIGQRLSGVSLKLLAYERLLQDYPAWQNHVVMVQRLLLPGSRKADEAYTTREVRALVQRLQDKFGAAVIDYQELSGTSLPMDQRLALWKASDIFMSTPIREGLNHWPMDYIYAHKEPEVPGVIITSEFSAVSSILNGALRVNPYDIQMTVSTIDKALSMEMQEREGRRYRDIDFVSTSPSDKWVKNVLRDLRDATARRSSSSESNSQMSTPYETPRINQSSHMIDSTAAFLARESNLAFCHLNYRVLKRAFDATKRRVIFLDFNGTIVLKEPPGKYLKREILGTSGNKPPPEVLDALTILCQDPRNTVYVVSGDSSENVLSALGQLPSLGLAVSNGGRFSPPLQPGERSRRWLSFDLGVDWDAVKRVALPVLSKYTARTNGSFVKLTSLSIGWSYYSCDPEWGSLQASYLVLELESELRAFDVRFVTLKGVVEVVPRMLNKGLIVKKVLRDMAKQHTEGVDFVLCFGDDISDEKMFTSCFTFFSELGDVTGGQPCPPVLREDGTIDDAMDVASTTTTADTTAVPEAMHMFTVAVGKKASHASFYVNEAHEVANSLVMLARGSIPDGGVPFWGRESASYMFT